MPTNSSYILESMDEKELKRKFARYSSMLDEYVEKSKIMDEKTFRRSFENDKGFLPFNYVLLSNTTLSVYRSRIARHVGDNEDLSSPQTFSYVPTALINDHFPRLQRANFSGQTVFYGSLSPTTNFREICEDITAGEEVYMAKWDFSQNAELMLYRILPPKGVFVNDLFRKIFRFDEAQADYIEAYFRKLGTMMMNSEEGNAKYLVSALYSNSIFQLPPINLPDGSTTKPFDGIVYPSTKMENGSELNIAIKPECIDCNAHLNYVIRGKVSKDLRSIDYTDIGFCDNGVIRWYSPWINYSDIKPTKVYFWDIDNQMVDTSKGVLFDKTGNKVTDPFALFGYKKSLWAKRYIQLFQESLRGNYNVDTIEEDHLPSTTFKDSGLLIVVDGWKLFCDNDVINIGKIGFDVQITSTFKRTAKPIGLNFE